MWMLWGVAQAADATFTVHVMRPPEHATPGITRVLVVAEESAESKAFAEQVAGELSRGTSQPNGPVSAEALKVPVTVFRGNVAGSLDPGSVAKLAKTQTAGLVIVGAAGGRQTALEKTKEERKITKKVDGREETKVISVDCQERLVSFSFTWSVYNGGDASVLVADSGSRSLSSKDCKENADDTITLASVSELVTPLVNSTADALVAKIRPGYTRWQAPAFRGKGYDDSFGALTKGDWAGAAAAVKRRLEVTPYDHRSVHHAALAALGAGKFEEALVLESWAARLDPSEATYAQTAEAITKRRADVAAFSAIYGVKPAQADVADLPALLETARRITANAVPAKGRRVKAPLLQQTVDLLAAPAKKKDSTILTEVHSGVVVVVVQEQDDWVEIRLPDEATGWLKKSNLEK